MNSLSLIITTHSTIFFHYRFKNGKKYLPANRWQETLRLPASTAASAITPGTSAFPIPIHIMPTAADFITLLDDLHDQHRTFSLFMKVNRFDKDPTLCQNMSAIINMMMNLTIMAPFTNNSSGHNTRWARRGA
ncbi:hypothetical protein OCU04_002385 [Sclerotinia nivalis]|uniref:Uncharacterized protein n=1 Tax=Sclerotinia nivalis TaxID=352851 RepID=A0A9X0DM48_9HELO|nr:hypothetical protein OCU04_002385 [Sclerotinia nivalis]